MKHIDGYIFIPYGGQRRFGLKTHDRLDGQVVMFVDPRPELNMMFPHQTAPTCRALTCDREDEEIMGLVMDKTADAALKLGAGKNTYIKLENGVHIILVNPGKVTNV